MSDYRYVDGTLSPIDVYWPADTDPDEDLENLGFSQVCQLGLERNDDQGLWAQVYARGARKPKRQIEGIPEQDQYAVMLGLCNEVRTVFAPDLPDLLKLLGELEPLIRLSLVTAQLQAVYDACAGMALCLPPPGRWKAVSRAKGTQTQSALAEITG